MVGIEDYFYNYIVYQVSYSLMLTTLEPSSVTTLTLYLPSLLIFSLGICRSATA